ncbi:MAG: protein translocase subunit SecF [Pseudomonas sp.]|nr:protein translocase subunit SecF [Pseudomonas sp.]
MNRTINFMGVRNIAFALTVLLTLVSLGSLFTKGLNLGLDFTGGTQIELSYEQPADLGNIRAQLAGAGYADAVVQSFGATTDVVVRMQGNDPDLGGKVAAALRQAGEQLEVKKVEFVGPQVGEELRDQGGLGLLLALGGIMLYLAFRFQWKFGVGAIVSLIHDVIVTLGILSFFQITFDLTVLAALLAIIGYSLNDTIVVFDRVRENMRLMRQTELTDIINISTTQTLGRTMATSFSTILVLLALFWFGGENIHGFATALLTGVGVGTYSSIYIAGGLLVTMKLTRDDLIPPQVEEAVDDRP